MSRQLLKPNSHPTVSWTANWWCGPGTGSISTRCSSGWSTPRPPCGGASRRRGPSFVAFDVLAVGSVDVRPMRWTVRRRRLESLAGRWVPPLEVSPVTADADEAREWLDAFKSSGVEGLVVKGASTRYQPGRRDWVKVNSIGVVVFDEINSGTYDQVSNGSHRA
ncbi:hypothetical protein [Kribbella sp. VKM Ac-2500]|uniref:ATP-dependent DNA ligase n=1 Tax=Kribbella sp. VKM Ac-2500 TaxID=2512214 RepID=UPI002105B6EB|nr:hypothetical protein [Kribbella sp. VKM Ac-2500]